VVGRDGRCVICHRDDAEDDDNGTLRRVLGYCLLGAALVAAVVVLKVAGGSRASDPLAVRGDAPVDAQAAPPPVREVGPPDRTPEETRAAARVAAEKDRQRDIEAEMHKIPVRMFMTRTCKLCDTAREYLQQKSLTYSEIDVEADPAAYEEMVKRSSSRQVPVFDVDGEVLVGFGPTNVIGAVRRAAEKRKRW
jgi:glutaredoxin